MHLVICNKILASIQQRTNRTEQFHLNEILHQTKPLLNKTERRYREHRFVNYKLPIQKFSNTLKTALNCFTSGSLSIYNVQMQNLCKVIVARTVKISKRQIEVSEFQRLIDENLSLAFDAYARSPTQYNALNYKFLTYRTE